MTRPDSSRRPDEAPADPSRRRFLGQASCAALSATALANTVLNLELFGGVAAAGSASDYKALICLFLTGGNDSFNMVVPRGSFEHAEYLGIRQDLALPRASLLPVTPTTSDGKEYGLHPAMSGMQSLFAQGHLAFVNNVGTLVEPTTLAQWNAETANLPLGLFSHADQIQQWQTSIPDARSGLGWGGRMADLIQELNASQRISMNISLSGTNVFQSGETVGDYAVFPGVGSAGLWGYGETHPLARLRTTAIDTQLAATYTNILEQGYREKMRSALDAHDEFSTALAGVPPRTSTFTTSNPVSEAFETVVDVIAARDTLEQSRHTFFVEFGGWDHHDEVLNNQQRMLGVVDQAVTELWAALGELGVQDDVVLFSSSDFGRTLTSNGAGSDHGWGGNQFVLGGAVRGGDFYGTYPDLHAGNELDTGRGRLIPTLSVDEYFAELARWMGVDSADVARVLPNIGRFWDPLSGSLPIGFLS
ncbi:MAG: DUF1501 domain-containing protein [Acidobacteriota bacterium]